MRASTAALQDADDTMLAMTFLTQSQLATRVEDLADQCVRCGLCLPHCPTYLLTQDEAESPRGRIAMAAAMATSDFRPSAAAQLNLDHCLACRSCEKVCPSQVQYEQLLVATRSLSVARQAKRPRGLQRVLADGMAMLRLARLAQRLHTWRWLPRLAGALPAGSLTRRVATAQLPAPPLLRRARTRVTPAPATRGSITLFRGCVASVHDRDTLAATRQLLEALGYAVKIPAADMCCGALAAHAGEAALAARQAEHAAARLQRAAGDHVLVTASGCFGTVRELAATHQLSVDAAHRFIAHDSRLDSLRFRPLAATAALHLPCTEVNVVDGGAPLRRLLGRINGLAVQEMPLQPRCCGAAGSYFLQQPEMADALRSQKLDQAAQLTPDYILTSNIGCRMHFLLGLGPSAAHPEVVHPLTLLARQLEYPDEKQ